MLKAGHEHKRINVFCRYVQVLQVSFNVFFKDGKWEIAEISCNGYALSQNCNYCTLDAVETGVNADFDVTANNKPYTKYRQ